MVGVSASASGDLGGVSATGGIVYINPNNIEFDDGPSFQQVIAITRPFDATSMSHVKVTLDRTRAGSHGDSNVRLFANYGFGNPHQFYIAEYWGATGSATSLLPISHWQNKDLLRFQVRASRLKEPGDGLSNVFPPCNIHQNIL